jgi:CO/xanthine dehydrogenase Mo-binding subunit
MKCLNAMFCEVEVDTGTGQVFVDNLVDAIDTGKTIRVSSTKGQLEAYLYGTIGWGLLEQNIYDPATGVLLSGNALEYKPPTIVDVLPALNEPVVFEMRAGVGAYGATGICHQVQDKYIINLAVYNAIGVWIDDIPITPDKVLAALGTIPASSVAGSNAAIGTIPWSSAAPQGGA